jgi:hypothetical protein
VVFSSSMLTMVCSGLCVPVGFVSYKRGRGN